MSAKLAILNINQTQNNISIHLKLCIWPSVKSPATHEKNHLTFDLLDVFLAIAVHVCCLVLSRLCKAGL